MKRPVISATLHEEFFVQGQGNFGKKLYLEVPQGLPGDQAAKVRMIKGMWWDTDGLQIELNNGRSFTVPSATVAFCEHGKEISDVKPKVKA